MADYSSRLSSRLSSHPARLIGTALLALLALSACKRPTDPQPVATAADTPPAVIFEASGSPGWALSISQGKIAGMTDVFNAALDYSYGEKHAMVPLNKNGQMEFMGSFTDTGSLQPLRITLIKENCTMESGDTRPVTVRIAIGAQKLDGCGAFKESAR